MYHVINGTSIDENGLIDLFITLLPNKKDCVVTVSSENYELYITNQSMRKIKLIITNYDIYNNMWDDVMITFVKIILFIL